MDVMASFSPNFRKLKMARPKIKFCVKDGGKNISNFRLRIGNIELVCGMFSLCARPAKRNTFFPSGPGCVGRDSESGTRAI